jgi:5-methylcytosine-specific restriction protein B
MAVWWCNQSRQWEVERRASVVCSSDEADNVTYRQTVGAARRGDVIVHYRAPSVVAFSRAVEDGKPYDALPLLSGQDYGSGWRFCTQYFDLSNPVRRDIFAPDLVPLIVKHHPLDRRGHVRQGYFFPFTLEGLQAVLDHLQEPMPDWLFMLRRQRGPEHHRPG